jgi:hypothetical protein
MKSTHLSFVSLLGLVLLWPAPASGQGTIFHMSPSAANPNGRSFTLIVNGAQFGATAVIHWNGNPCPTTFVRADKLTAAIPGQYVRGTGTATVTVVDPEIGTSNERTFTITSEPLAEIRALQPVHAEVGGKSFRLTVFGTGFKSGSVVYWNGYGRPTTFFNNTDVDALIYEEDIAFSGVADVCLVDRNTGLATASVTYKIRSALTPPGITSISPKTTAAGGSSFKLTVIGSDFTPTSVVRWGGENRPTTFIDASTLTADIPDSDIAEPGSISITVLETARGGGLSNPATFVIESPPEWSADFYFPYVAVGGGTTTSLTLLNWGAESAVVKLVLRNHKGDPMDVAVSEQLVQEKADGSSFTTSLEAGSIQAFTIASRGSEDPPGTGWAHIQTTQSMIQATLTYRTRTEGALRSVTAASAARPTNYFVTPINNNDDEGRFSGFVLANPSEEELNLLVITVDEHGDFLELANPPELNPLPPQGQAKIFLHDILPETTLQQGSVIVIDELGRSFLGATIMVENGLVYLMPVQ